MLLVVAAVVVAVLRTHHEPAALPQPSPTPSSIPLGTVVLKPPPGGVRAVLLRDGTPAFVTSIASGFTTYTAAGGPEHAQVLLGWCAAHQVFQDEGGTYVYDRDGAPQTPGIGLAQHASVDTPDGRLIVDDAAHEVSLSAGAGGGARVGARHLATCPAKALVWPPLPPRADRITGTGRYAVVTGRYRVTTETFEFCAGPACPAGGWEIFNVPSLPPDDLAGEYVWEGRYAVRANGADGTLRAIRLPGTRLVRRTRVGVRAAGGIALQTQTSRGRALLRMQPFFVPGSGKPQPVRDYVVRPDAEIYLGRGFTGLGLPKGTFATLHRFLLVHHNPSLWLILDARGQVIRVVAEGPSESVTFVN